MEHPLAPHDPNQDSPKDPFRDWNINPVFIWSSLLIFAGLVFVFGLRQEPDYDIWWHLATGRYIVEEQTIPRVDIFSFTRQGNAWIDLHWGFQLIVYLIHSLFGADGLIVFRVLCLLAAYGIAGSAVKPRRSPLCFALVFGLAVTAANINFLIRPIIMTLVFLSITVAVLIKWREKHSRWIYILPPLQMLWVNVHSLFILGLFAIYCFAGAAVLERLIPLPWSWSREPEMDAGRMKQILLIALLGTAACLINPFHVHGLIFPYQLFLEVSGRFGTISRYTGEFASPFSGQINVLNIEALIILLLLGALSFILNYTRIRPAYLFTWLGFAYLAAVGARNISVFSIVTASITVLNLSQFGSAVKHRVSVSFPLGMRKAAVYGLFIPVILWQVWVIDYVVTNRYFAQTKSFPFGLGVAWYNYPRGAADFIEQHKIPGRMFNTFEDGGYLIYRLYPQYQVFIDGRQEVSGLDFFNRYVELIKNPRDWDRLTGQYGINMVLIRHAHQSYSPLMTWFFTNPHYALVYFDELSALFVPRKPELSALINEHEIKIKEPAQDVVPVSIPDSVPSLFSLWTTKQEVPLGPLGLARTYTYLELPRLAMQEYAKVQARAPYLFDIYRDLGGAMVNKNKLDQAEKYLEFARRLNDNNPQVFVNLALVAEHRFAEQPGPGTDWMKQAEKNYRRALAMSPFSGEILNDLAVVYYTEGKISLCIEYLDRAMKDPYYEEKWTVYLNQALAYMSLGKCVPAEKFLESAMELKPNKGKVNYLKGIMLKAKGQEQAAAEFFRKAGQDPEFKIPPADLVQSMVNQCLTPEEKQRAEQKR